MSSLKLGDAVSVGPTHEWAAGATGVVATPPEIVRSLGKWDGCFQTIRLPNGRAVITVWVEFNSDVYDPDDGRRIVAEAINSEFLRLRL